MYTHSVSGEVRSREKRTWGTECPMPGCKGQKGESGDYGPVGPKVHSDSLVSVIYMYNSH